MRNLCVVERYFCLCAEKIGDTEALALVAKHALLIRAVFLFLECKIIVMSERLSKNGISRNSDNLLLLGVK
ncbi:hypothetical protein C7R88_01325 [Plesiomonas shigelloides]|nr:hypothetical protein C7R88_01325 [Plesiomonas shigelloides]